jgi:hypothetical protein
MFAVDGGPLRSNTQQAVAVAGSCLGARFHIYVDCNTKVQLFPAT